MSLLLIIVAISVAYMAIGLVTARINAERIHLHAKKRGEPYHSDWFIEKTYNTTVRLWISFCVFLWPVAIGEWLYRKTIPGMSRGITRFVMSPIESRKVEYQECKQQIAFWKEILYDEAQSSEQRSAAELIISLNKQKLKGLEKFK